MDPISPQIPQTPTAQSAPGSGPALSSDYETFLRMLTVQMQNQDPLNPADPTELAVQLATFSSVEQQVQTNTLLQGLEARLGAMSVTQIAGWIGLDALTTAPARFDGAPLTLALPVNSLADRAELVVTDETGLPRQRVTIDPAQTDLVWAGADADGTPFDSGVYKFTVEHFAGDTLLGSAPVGHYARVSEARLAGPVPTLVLETGAEVRSDEILGLSKPV